MKDETVIIKEGKAPGKTVAVFCGVHGNERAGVEAVRQVLEEVEIVSGKVFFVFANPGAIEKNVRYVEKNLNRCFLKNNIGETIEEKRAIELMKILDECEILLDIHASNNPQSTPFAICEKNGYEICKNFDFEIVSSGWDELEPGGADGYMFNEGKIGICLECGSVLDQARGNALAKKSIYQFLKYTGNVIGDIAYDARPQRFLEMTKVAKKKTEDVSFKKEYADFEMLTAGEVFARDGAAEYVAGTNECIVFPNLNKKIGEEIFLIGRFI